jgi:hypothetical protein
MSLKNDLFLRTISDIKLKRTDTTLDLSQKACCTLLAIIIDEVGGQVELTKRAEEKEKKRKNRWRRQIFVVSQSALLDASTTSADLAQAPAELPPRLPGQVM